MLASDGVAAIWAIAVASLTDSSIGTGRLRCPGVGCYMLGFAKMTSTPRGQASQDVFHAIADGNRRILIDLMEPGPRAVGELVLASGMSYSATSQHLAILRRAGLVSSEASGRRRIYRLRPAGLREVYDWSGRYRQFWRGRLDALGSEQP